MGGDGILQSAVYLHLVVVVRERRETEKREK